ncbi:unnamed protein product, partial [Dicrocoelium dendriticum]
MKNGNLYQGQVHNGFLHGRGKYTWNEAGVTYVGEFVQNQITGTGRLEWRDGDYYEGEFLNGLRHGSGRYCHQSGISYDGQWLSGKKHGKGRLEYTSDGTCFYEGDWVQGRRHGFGVHRYLEGSKYEGQWACGERSGEGTMWWNDRDEVYTGNWLNGKQNGMGTYTWRILRVKSTQYFLPNMYHGKWEDGKRNGLGTFYYPNGSSYVGQWKNDAKHGKGTLNTKDGRVFQLLFENDFAVGPTSNSVNSDGLPVSPEYPDTPMPVLPVYFNGTKMTEHIPVDTSDTKLQEHTLCQYGCGVECSGQEFRKIQNLLNEHLPALRCIYKYYGQVGTEPSPDNTVMLKYVQFCQFFKDCKLHHYVSLATMESLL